MMFDWSQMVNTLYPAVQQQIASFPPAQRAALAKIEARVIKDFPQITIEIRGDDSDPQVSQMMQTIFNSLGGTIPQVVGLLGPKVKLYE